MRLAIYSHKRCWSSAASRTGYATDGGFPFQMGALSQLFDRTVVVVPCARGGSSRGETPLEGEQLRVAPLAEPAGSGFLRKALFPFWVLRNSAVLVREARACDVIHSIVPGDVGTVGMFLALLARKKLLVRHCGNWFVQQTIAEHFWKWFMERLRGRSSVMLATGGGASRPSERNPGIRWIFSTSLWERELETCGVDRDGEVRASLIIACRQDAEKGTGVVIESLPLLLGRFPEATLDVVGDGAALEEFRRAAATLGLKDRVTFHGKVDRDGVIRLLRRATLFCYPTRASEGFPKVVLEALACGLPVVTTRVSVLPELIAQGCGVLAEPTPAAVAEAVARCLSDPHRYREMSRCAMTVARRFSLERWRDTIGGLLRTHWGELRAHA